MKRGILGASIAFAIILSSISSVETALNQENESHMLNQNQTAYDITIDPDQFIERVIAYDRTIDPDITVDPPSGSLITEFAYDKPIDPDRFIGSEYAYDIRIDPDANPLKYAYDKPISPLDSTKLG